MNNVASVNEYIKSTVATVEQHYNMKESAAAATNGPKELYQRKHRSRWKSSNKKSINEDYLGNVDFRTLLTTIVENLHAVSHFKSETFTALQYARDLSTIAKESLKRTTKWSAKYFTQHLSTVQFVNNLN